MHYNQSTGKKVEVMFNHLYEKLTIDGHLDGQLGKTKEFSKPYGTVCSIKIDEQVHTYTEKTSICHPKDQFKKVKGRLKSFNKALNYYRMDGYVILDKLERRELFNLVFPKLKNDGPTSSKARRLQKIKETPIKSENLNKKWARIIREYQNKSETTVISITEDTWVNRIKNGLAYVLGVSK